MLTEHPLTPFTFSIDQRDRQIADFGASYRKTSTLSNNGKGEAGDVSILKAGEVVVFAQPTMVRIATIQEGAVYQSKINGCSARGGSTVSETEPDGKSNQSSDSHPPRKSYFRDVLFPVSGQRDEPCQ